MPSLSEQVRRLVGDISPRQYRHGNVALARHLGVFTPISGQTLARFVDAASPHPVALSA